MGGVVHGETFIANLKSVFDDHEYKTTSAEGFLVSVGMSPSCDGFQCEYIKNQSTRILGDLQKSNPEVVAFVAANSAALKNSKIVEGLLVTTTNDQFYQRGYFSSHQAGVAIPRTVTLTYVKTEKGWVKTQ